MTPGEMNALIEQAATSLRSGDGQGARRHLAVIESAWRAGQLPGQQPPWFLVAQAALAMGDDDGEAQALERLLIEEPRHLAGLLMTARLKTRLGDRRSADSFYRTAFAVVEQAGDPSRIPTSLHGWLDEGQRFLAQSQAEYGEHLTAALTAEGLAPGAVSPRIDMAIDLLLGRKQLYLQQPTTFYFPGLPQRQFFETQEFEWAATFEAEAAAMQTELAAVLDHGDRFDPYVQSNPDRPLSSNPLRDDPSWGARYLWEYGTLVEDHARHAPRTMATLALAPMPQIAERSPMALYSRLTPGTHIQPHCGMLNTRLICHLPLITNDQCAIRVGNETRSWQLGKLLIFDDSIEHEAWNRGTENRYVLLFEIWRPELSPDERRALVSLFGAIGAYGNMPRDQG